MAVYDILPTSELKGADVRDTLNAYGGTVGDYFPDYFTEAANINMWSRRKPVALQADFCQDFSASEAFYDADWWKGKNGDCGITFPSYTTMDAVRAAMDGENNGWVYTLPSGGSSEPYRMGDFRGYSPLAAPPFKALYIPERVPVGQNITVMFESNIVPVDSSLNLDDFVTLGNCYLGVKLYNESTGEQTWNTTEEKLSEGTKYQIPVSTSGLNVGSGWKAFPFLSTAVQEQWQPTNSAVFYSIPIVKEVSFSIVTDADVLVVYAQYLYASGANLPSSLRYKFSYTNGSGGSTSNNTLLLYKSGSSSASPGELDYSVSLPDFTCGYGSTYNYPYDATGSEWATVSIANFDPTTVTWLGVSIGSGQTEEYVQILRQSATDEV